MDGNVITAKRTAAVSAIATKVRLVPGRAKLVGSVGCLELEYLREK